MSGTEGVDRPDGPTYEEWVAALDRNGFYLECANGHGSLPPRRVCPECGDTDLTQRSLPGTGTVATFSEVHVAGPAFAGETPYVTAVVDFGPVRLTGVLREVAADEVAVGDEVRADVEPDGPGDRPLVVFRPA
ncbi:Zn-ribbon domain-containing OB-fold protein [Halorarum salinum]|uniref:OB-fold domain-containing protein n=1 Tax=Halorarum salinum TaxID=2743089 RepID=A0A7D5LCM0_9EURY|nr:OB-fold domain-containing protein [Halobaculum salinum]QLG63450.1 OB-fold domain-containing protein [Halobaculum salinum]